MHQNGPLNFLSKLFIHAKNAKNAEFTESSLFDFRKPFPNLYAPLGERENSPKTRRVDVSPRTYQIEIFGGVGGPPPALGLGA